MNPILTIAIPTFNRRNKLQMSLTALLEQAQGKPVELLVSDNASTDDTQKFMESFCLQHPQITYVRNPENIGPDRNFLNCYNRSSGEYVLLLGDDDLLLPGAVDAMLQTLSRKPVFVCMNSCGLRNTDPLEITAPRYPEGKDQVYTRREDIMRCMGIMVTFMSSFILRNDLVKAIPDKERYIGTYFIQSHIALQTLKAEGEYVFITKNCIAATGNESVGYDLYFVWGRMYGQLLNTTGIEAGIDPQLIHQLHYTDLKETIFDFVMYYRATCSNSKSWDKTCIMEQVKSHPKLYCKYWIAVNLPLAMAKFFRACSHFVNKLIGK